MAFTDEQINDFLEVAQEVGIGRAMRRLGYPKSWNTARRWAETRNITVAVDQLKQRSKEFHDWYTTEEVLIVAQEGMQRVYEELLEAPVLMADDQKKLSEALTKHYNVWANAQGKATNISESRQSDQMDSHIMDLLNTERAKNARKSSADSNLTNTSKSDNIDTKEGD